MVIFSALSVVYQTMEPATTEGVEFLSARAYLGRHSAGA